MLIISLLPLLVGLVFGVLLFLKWPVLPADSKEISQARVSVIIPARNEEQNVAFLLEGLAQQSKPAFEILCIDDESGDATADVARAQGARVISIKDKPEEWTGKTYACEFGASHCSGDLLLFLDADVRLGPQALEKLAGAYQKHGCVISVQPYHIVNKLYEQLSLFFNLILICANGVSLPIKNKGIGLFGPVILISRQDYSALGGYLSAKSSVAEDLVLGEAMKRNAMAFKLFLGAEDIRFQMYSGGLSDLIEGWTKNFASGALKTPLFLLFMIIMWLGALTSATTLFVDALAFGITWKIMLYAFLYACSVIVVAIPARKAGSFSATTLIFYPVALFGFYLIFVSSLIKKIMRRKVVWKGREIKLRR